MLLVRNIKTLAQARALTRIDFVYSASNFGSTMTIPSRTIHTDGS
jgi:hypothetical protein